ncbi:hypothetical protein BLOT_000176 [Blomia tropicalis]|nr:hypothetical protein BLOT_000176 [Blomia tropicalis]
MFAINYIYGQRPYTTIHWIGTQINSTTNGRFNAIKRSGIGKRDQEYSDSNYSFTINIYLSGVNK